jgi:hypothetical protein
MEDSFKIFFILIDIIFRNMKKTTIIAAASLMAFSSVYSDDGPPSLLTYQGHLVNAQGEPVGNDSPAIKSIEFRIFDAEEGGNVKYAEAQTVTVDKGYFSVLIGQGTAIPGLDGPPDTPFSDVFKGDKSDERFIGIRVDGADINPRLRYVASPYAVLSQRSIVAGNADTVTTIQGHKADTAGRADSALKADSAAKVDTIAGHTADKAKWAQTTDQVTYGSVPKYGIIMWTQSKIPTNWRLCNGTGGTPDLRNRFIIGAGQYYKLHLKGGANWSKISTAQLPAHNHSGAVHHGGNHYHHIYTRQDDWNDSGGWGPSWGNGDNGHYRGYHTTHWAGHHNHGLSIYNTGSNHWFDNQPAYYAVYYIMRVK